MTQPNFFARLQLGSAVSVSCAIVSNEGARVVQRSRQPVVTAAPSLLKYVVCGEKLLWPSLQLVLELYEGGPWAGLCG